METGESGAEIRCLFEELHLICRVKCATIGIGLQEEGEEGLEIVIKLGGTTAKLEHFIVVQCGALQEQRNEASVLGSRDDETIPDGHSRPVSPPIDSLMKGARHSAYEFGRHCSGCPTIALCVGKLEREAQIDNFDVALRRDHHIIRFHISMNISLIVDVCDGLHQLRAHPLHLPISHMLLHGKLRASHPTDVLKHYTGTGVMRTDTDGLHDVRVVAGDHADGQLGGILVGLVKGLVSVELAGFDVLHQVNRVTLAIVDGTHPFKTDIQQVALRAVKNHMNINTFYRDGGPFDVRAGITERLGIGLRFSLQESVQWAEEMATELPHQDPVTTTELGLPHCPRIRATLNRYLGIALFLEPPAPASLHQRGECSEDGDENVELHWRSLDLIWYLDGVAICQFGIPSSDRRITIYRDIFLYMPSIEVIIGG